MADRMTTDAPSLERVAVEQADWTAAGEHRDRYGLNGLNRDHLAQTPAVHRIAAVQASDAEIERLKAESARLREAIGYALIEELSPPAERRLRAALAAGTSQEVGRG